VCCSKGHRCQFKLHMEHTDITSATCSYNKIVHTFLLPQDPTLYIQGVLKSKCQRVKVERLCLRTLNYVGPSRTITEHACLLGCDTISIGIQLQMFWSSLLPVFTNLKIVTANSSEPPAPRSEPHHTNTIPNKYSTHLSCLCTSTNLVQAGCGC
jgi:hypothetical protein